MSSPLACASSQSSTKLAANTPQDARMYQDAMKDLNDALYPEAVTKFSDLKTKFPYSNYAPLADLRIGDAHYKRGRFLEAVDAYRTFLKYNPNHAEAAYAMYQIAEAYRAQMPDNWWFLPPAAEKDQANTKLAIGAYQDVVSRFGDTEIGQKAQKNLDACRKKLAEHEIYTARFYLKHKHYAAAITRAEGILKNYPGLGLDEDAQDVILHAKQALAPELPPPPSAPSP